MRRRRRATGSGVDAKMKRLNGGRTHRRIMSDATKIVLGTVGAAGFLAVVAVAYIVLYMP